MKPHKHAETIKAWADGADIEYRARGSQEWKPIFEGWSWDNSLVAECRVKPEPKPDWGKLVRIDTLRRHICRWEESSLPNANLHLTFDGETNKLKSAEVI
jgi:hypothetical protein